MKSEYKVMQLTRLNPHSLTDYEISGNDREKALELLAIAKEKEKNKPVNNKKREKYGVTK